MRNAIDRSRMEMFTYLQTHLDSGSSIMVLLGVNALSSWLRSCGILNALSE